MKKNESDIEMLRQLVGIWEILTEEEQQLIVQNYRIVHYKKNELIYRHGESSRNLLCVLKGKVKIYKDGVGGRTQIMRMMKPMQYFGYRAYFAGEEYVTNAAAVESTTIACIPLPVIVQLLTTNNQLGMFFIKELAVDLGESDCRTVNLTQKHIRGRLAEALVLLIEKYGMEEDGVTINIYLSREDLANLSNMTTSNAIRTLSIFVNERIIAVDGRRIKIIDEDHLRRISQIG
ncbi:MAG: Crp/Fnr family transcriptional regulator [Bacteroidales bacterium]